jgi:hypothetical protein
VHLTSDWVLAAFGTYGMVGLYRILSSWKDMSNHDMLPSHVKGNLISRLVAVRLSNNRHSYKQAAKAFNPQQRL